MTKAELVSALDWIRDDADIYAIWGDASKGDTVLFGFDSLAIKLSPSSRVEIHLKRVSTSNPGGKP